MFVVPATGTGMREGGGSVCPLSSEPGLCETELAELERLQKSLEEEGVCVCVFKYVVGVCDSE